MVVRRQGGDVDTAASILDVAERLVQSRGFNGFSYADVAAELGITKPALHYHFASKAELGEALIKRYADRFAAALGDLDASASDDSNKLRGYVDLYLEVLRDKRMCLCGMLAAEYQTLPAPMRDAVLGFFDRNETWLEGVLHQGRVRGGFRFEGTALDEARMIVAGLEGAMLVARPFDDTARFEVAASQMIHDIIAPLPDGA
jgi:TetR/AcrR family transcriptional regulator, transcriptional repressor for nem operon